MIPSQEEWYRALEERCGAGLQRAFSSAAVAVCGLGGLGSNIAAALARAGVGNLLILIVWISPISTASSIRRIR